MSNKEVIEKTEEKQEGVGVYTLLKPTKIEGEEKTEIPYDLNSINGLAIRNAKTILGKKAYVVVTPQFDEVYNAALFAEASGLSFESIEALSAKDYMNIVDIVKDFMYGED
jgi:hypothetical protein